MNKINFQPIFEYIDKTKVDLKKELVEEVFNEFNNRFDKITNLIDSVLKEMKTHNQETGIMGHRVDRLEGWADKVSKKVRIPTNF